jgi:type II secretory pathway component PulF
MVKLRHKGLLVLGITRKELDALREGAPIPVPLGDLHESLKGQLVMLIPGEDNGSLKRVMDTVANAYENGATSPIEIAKSIPRVKMN